MSGEKKNRKLRGKAEAKGRGRVVEPARGGGGWGGVKGEKNGLTKCPRSPGSASGDAYYSFLGGWFFDPSFPSCDRGGKYFRSKGRSRNGRFVGVGGGNSSGPRKKVDGRLRWDERGRP